MSRISTDKTISYKDIQKGDKIRVSGIVDVKSVRFDSSDRLGDIAIVGIDLPDGKGESQLAILASDAIRLLEREATLTIPEDAKVVSWDVTTGKEGEPFERFYAVRSNEEQEWVSSDADTYESDAELTEDILNHQFGVGNYIDDSFQVLVPAPKPKFASGGVLGGINIAPITLDSLARLANQRIVGASQAQRAGMSR